MSTPHLRLSAPPTPHPARTLAALTKAAALGGVVALALGCSSAPSAPASAPHAPRLFQLQDAAQHASPSDAAPSPPPRAEPLLPPLPSGAAMLALDIAPDGAAVALIAPAAPSAPLRVLTERDGAWASDALPLRVRPPQARLKTGPDGLLALCLPATLSAPQARVGVRRAGRWRWRALRAAPDAPCDVTVAPDGNVWLLTARRSGGWTLHHATARTPRGVALTSDPSLGAPTGTLGRLVPQPDASPEVLFYTRRGDLLLKRATALGWRSEPVPVHPTDSNAWDAHRDPQGRLHIVAQTYQGRVHAILDTSSGWQWTAQPLPSARLHAP